VEVKVIYAVDEDIFLMVVLPTSIEFIKVKIKIEDFRLF
jgi:hypothetical protein